VLQNGGMSSEGPQPGRVIRVGVAGWDYPDWNGIVYPTPAPRGVDRLAWLARFVDVVEINSTFYRPADPHVAASWVRRTEGRPELRFTAKGHRSWTHEAGARLDGAVPPTLAGLTPLREAGVLGALLVQFPQSFHRTDEALERLARLLERLDGWPVVVELRHASWDAGGSAEWLRQRGAGWCVVDQPRIGRSTAAPTPRVTSAVGYLRLHGRNAADWFRAGAGRDARYDYLYTPAELEGLASTARRLATQAREVFVIQNNHFRGKALVNALQMKRLLEAVRPPAPAGLIGAYPELEAITVPEPGRLF
jgi:uncharacterized protein YecE (DUF72 family)